jgi:hypothetical protein
MTARLSEVRVSSSQGGAESDLIITFNASTVGDEHA